LITKAQNKHPNKKSDFFLFFPILSRFLSHLCNTKTNKVLSMKKFIMMLVCMFAVHTMVMADNDRPIQVNQLPAKAQTFIKTYFKNHKVALAKMESGVFYKSYDVVFTNGEKVEFDKVRCRQSEVPAQVVPEAIRNYVKTNYPDARILEIEFDHNEYEIKLSNRWEITFDSQMRVIDIDD
jgi:hypothetical protein